MSNKATIQRTIFFNVPKGEKTYGYRIYDDYGQSYSNTMTEEDMELSPEDFLRKVVPHLDDTGSSIFHVSFDTGGIYIDDEWFTLKMNDGGWSLVKE
jgi:hypothetical protein